MKTSKYTGTLLTVLLFAGSGTLLQGQNTSGTCPLGNEPAYRGGGPGQGHRAGQGLGQPQRRGQRNGTGPRCAGTACPLDQAAQTGAEITAADANNILFLKQEEKLARDVYQALAAKWQHATFANIAVSEQRHMDAVDRLIEAFGLEDTTPDATGQFSIPELQELHDDLLAEGGKSLADALKVGARIEEADIEDLDSALAGTANPAVSRVLTNLRRGSDNHLAAFTRALEALESAGPDETGTSLGNARHGAPRQGLAPNRSRGGR
jgi:hypothetical protein